MNSHDNHRGFSLTDNPKISNGTNYLVGIAIDSYKYCTPLRNAVKDTQAFIQILLKQYQFDSQHLHTLFNEAATRSNIITLLESLVSHVGPSDNLIIYFAGHGHLNPKTQRGAWITVESKPNVPSSHLKNSTIIDYLKDIPSKHTFLISDSCFSGKLFAQHRSSNVSLHYQKVYEVPSRWGLTSGRAELVSDGPQSENSPFAKALLECLEKNSQPFLSAWELINYVQKYVGVNHKQQPIGNRFYGVDDRGLGQFVFIKKGKTIEDSVPKNSFIPFSPTLPNNSNKSSSLPNIKIIYGGLGIIILMFCLLILRSRFIPYGKEDSTVIQQDSSLVVVQPEVETDSALENDYSKRENKVPTRPSSSRY